MGVQIGQFGCARIQFLLPPTMDTRDFEGLTKFKLILPALYILSWLAMLIGPSYFPNQYQYFIVFCLIYLLIKILQMLLTLIYIAKSSYSLTSNLQSESNPPNGHNLNNPHWLNHIFVVPNYREEYEVLCQTLKMLASHPGATQNYYIFLAMEAHQPDADSKAQHLQEQFSNSFRHVGFTSHVLRENEQKGKASNVSWCVESLQPFFEKNMLNPDTVLLTIMDADSWLPPVYISAVEGQIRDNEEQFHKTIFQPLQMFTRNHLSVPVFTRICDLFHSFAHASTCYSCFGVTFPLSNYSLPYSLVKRIGFWDTCADAIGEDLHTTAKAFWKTRAEVVCKPIYIPTNQVNLSTGLGYWEDVKARFWQTQRHAKGVADFAWCFKMLLQEPFKLKNFIVFLTVFETFAVFAIVPWAILALNYQKITEYLLQKQAPQPFGENFVDPLLILINVMGAIGYLLYQFVKRRTNRIVYQQENESIFRMLEYPLVLPIVLAVFAIPPFVMAAFSTPFGAQEYVVSRKKISDGNS